MGTFGVPLGLYSWEQIPENLIQLEIVLWLVFPLGIFVRFRMGTVHNHFPSNNETVQTAWPRKHIYHTRNPFGNMFGTWASCPMYWHISMDLVWVETVLQLAIVCAPLCYPAAMRESLAVPPELCCVHLWCDVM